MRWMQVLLLVAAAAAFVFGIEWLYVALGLLLLVMLVAEAGAPRMPPAAERAPEMMEEGRRQIIAAQVRQSQAHEFMHKLITDRISESVEQQQREEEAAAITGAIGGVSKKLSKKIDSLEKKIDKLEKNKPRRRRYPVGDD